MDRDQADWLATWEAVSEPAPSDVPARRVYQAEDPIEDDSELPITDVLPLIANRSLDANGLRAHAERRAPLGCRWVKFMDHDRSWRGAALYLGDEPIRAWLVPD